MTDTERKIIFSSNLLNELNKSKKSQIEVAKSIGVSQQTFNTWCRGVALPRMGKIQLLADYFNIDMSDLIEPHSIPSISPDLKLSETERELIEAYRNANDTLQIAACAVLGVKRESESEEVILSESAG